MVTKDTSADSLKRSIDKICLTISLSSDLRRKTTFTAPLEESKGFLLPALLRGDAAFLPRGCFLSFNNGEMRGSELQNMLRPTHRADATGDGVWENPLRP